MGWRWSCLFVYPPPPRFATYQELNTSAWTPLHSPLLPFVAKGASSTPQSTKRPHPSTRKRMTGKKSFTKEYYAALHLNVTWTTYCILCHFSSRTPTFRKTVTIPTPRTPTPFKNALAAQEKMHGPLKMEVRALWHTRISAALSLAWLTAVERLVSATTAGFPRRRHPWSSEAGNRSGHLQQSGPARLQAVETDGECRLHVKYLNLFQVETLHLKGKSRL